MKEEVDPLAYSFYIAGSYERKAELAELARLLQQRGYEVVSDWLFNAADPGLARLHETADNDWPDDELADLASQDLAQIRQAEVFVLLTGRPDLPIYRAGRMVEMGYALAHGLKVCIIGPRQNIFCHLRGTHILRYPDVETFLRVWLEEGGRDEHP